MTEKVWVEYERGVLVRLKREVEANILYEMGVILLSQATKMNIDIAGNYSAFGMGEIGIPVNN